MNENLDKRELNLNDLDAVSGGSRGDRIGNFYMEMWQKYGTKNWDELRKLMNEEEKRTARELGLM